MIELHEEYIQRHKGRVKANLVKYVDRGFLILRSRDKNSEWAWLHVNIASAGDANHPQKFSFVVSANPTLYTTSDFQHFSNHSKVLKEQQWEWDQYEQGLVDWAKEQCSKYTAITSSDAVFVAWEMFATNYDTWIAHFLPYRLQENVYQSLNEKDKRTSRISAIKEVEDYIKEKYERVFLCWKNIRSAIDQKNYADWLAKVVNDMVA